MTSQIICNILMFLSYILNIFCMVIALLILPKGLKNLNKLCDGLSEKEIFQIHQKKFTGSFFKLLIANLLFLVVGIITCLLDGLSDMENGLLIPTWTFLIVGFVLVVFFIIYTYFLRRKYKIVMTCSVDPAWNRGYCAAAQIGMCMLIAFLFAFNSALTAYTIWLL